MNESSESVVSDQSSSSSVWVDFQIVLDERLIDDAVDKFRNELSEYSDLIGLEMVAELMEIEKELRFRDAIQSKLKSGGIHLDTAGKNNHGEDTYRMS